MLALTLAQWERVPIMVSRDEPLCTSTLSSMIKIVDWGFLNASKYGILLNMPKVMAKGIPHNMRYEWEPKNRHSEAC